MSYSKCILKKVLLLIWSSPAGISGVSCVRKVVQSACHQRQARLILKRLRVTECLQQLEWRTTRSQTRSHEETEETIERSAHRSRGVAMIALALNALIAIKGLLVWS